MVITSIRACGFLGMSLSLLLCLGCAGGRAKDLPTLYPMHGVVTLDGKPLPKATVSLLPEVGPSSGAITDAEGKYVMLHRSGEAGAVKGPAKVVIITATMDEKGNMTPELLPAKYNTNTTLVVDVKEGDNDFPFDLKSK